MRRLTVDQLDELHRVLAPELIPPLVIVGPTAAFVPEDRADVAIEVALVCGADPALLAG